jgi:hypothetical protein
MKSITQKDDLGCAVACVAFVLEITYEQSLAQFKNGKTRVQEKSNFYCPEIARILNSAGLDYSWRKINENNIDLINGNFSIVFVKRFPEDPYGHFLCRYGDQWMDSWINLDKCQDYRKAISGFRKDLPGKPLYVIFLNQKPS